LVERRRLTLACALWKLDDHGGPHAPEVALDLTCEGLGSGGGFLDRLRHGCLALRGGDPVRVSGPRHPYEIMSRDPGSARWRIEQPHVTLHLQSLADELVAHPRALVGQLLVGRRLSRREARGGAGAAAGQRAGADLPLIPPEASGIAREALHVPVPGGVT